MWARQFRRARRLSSERRMYQGACLVSVAASIRSRAREYSYQRGHDSTSIGRQLPLPQRILDARRRMRRSCSLCPDLQPELDQLDAAVDDASFRPAGRARRKLSYCSLRAEAHDVLDAGAVVPAAIEDHDLARRREVRDVALHVHLRLLAIGGRRQRHDPEDARADPLGERADRPALAGRVAALEDDDDAAALRA